MQFFALVWFTGFLVGRASGAWQKTRPHRSEALSFATANGKVGVGKRKDFVARVAPMRKPCPESAGRKVSLFYKMDPAAWDFGTAELSLEAEAAYLRIVNAIHKHDGPVPNNDRVLAGLFRSSTRKARALLQDLLDAGKVSIDGGFIWNERARSDLVRRGFATISASERGAKGGRKRAENAAKALENNKSGQAIASSRIEENRIEEKEEAIASKKKPISRAVQLPEGWVPSERNIADAEAKGFSARETQDEADRFRDYHRAKGTTFKDWDAGWRTWLGNARKFARGGMAVQANPGGGGRNSSFASVVARRRLESDQGLPFDS